MYCKLIASVRLIDLLGNTGNYGTLDSGFSGLPWKLRETDAKEKPKTTQALLLPEQMK